MQLNITSSIISKLGTSQTFKTLSLVTLPKPVNVAYKLLIACLISPSVVNNNVDKPA